MSDISKILYTKKGVHVQILETKQLPGETSVIISEYIQETIDFYNINDKLIAFCADNTNCNFGGAARRGKNNVFTKMQGTTENILIGVNCAAHILNNCIQIAVECLLIDVETVVVKIYSYFYIYSANRKFQRDM